VNAPSFAVVLLTWDARSWRFGSAKDSGEPFALPGAYRYQNFKHKEVRKLKTK